MDCSSCSKTFSEALAAWNLPATLLDGLDPDARPLLWRELRAVLEASTISQPRAALPFAYQHYARPRFQQRNLRDLDLAGWHKKLRLALWMAAEALDALCALPRANEYLTLLSEQCAWMGQLYADLKRRAGSFFAPVIFQGELRLLQYRTSVVVTDLLFAA